MKTCTRCHNEFQPVGNNTKRCPTCRTSCEVCGRPVKCGNNLCDICFYQTRHKKIYPAICQTCGQPFTSGQPKRMLCDTCRTKTCPICGKDFIIKIADPPNTYCSSECYQVAHAAPMRICALCGSEFKQRGGHPETKYCGPRCRYKAAKVPDSERHGGYKYKKWVTSVFERDDFTCQQCGATGAIHAHHVKEWHTNKDLRYEVSNGITLCQDCHQIKHGRVMTRASKRFQPICERCGKKTKGHSRYCQSCGIRLSPKAKSQRERMRRGDDGCFNQLAPP